MRKKSTRLLSAALAVCMMVTVLPMGAFAAEQGTEEQENGASAQADRWVPRLLKSMNEFPDQVFQQYDNDNMETSRDELRGQRDGLNQYGRTICRTVRSV